MSISPDIKVLQEQIDDLQGRLAYQEDLLQTLNDVISNQDASIIKLQQQLRQSQERLDEVAYSIESKAQERPPHY